MKVEFRKRRILQQKYREQVEHRRSGKNHTLEAFVVVISFFTLLFYLNFLHEDKVVVIEHSNEERWMSVIPVIDEELKRTTHNYKGVSIDYNSKPIQIIIKTSIRNGFMGAENEMDTMINHINHIITDRQLTNETYKIIIVGNNGQRVKAKLFGA